MGVFKRCFLKSGIFGHIACKAKLEGVVSPELIKAAFEGI